MTNIQYCADDQDITGSPDAEAQATEIRAWDEDGTLLAAVNLRGGSWYEIDGRSIGTGLHNPREAAISYIRDTL